MSLTAFVVGFFLHGFFADESVAGYMPKDTIWTLTELDGDAVDPGITALFERGGALSGQAPCNRYRTTQTAPYPWFRIDPIQATKRACPDLALETRYFSLLAAMTLAELSGPVLLLSNDAGQTMVLEALD